MLPAKHTACYIFSMVPKTLRCSPYEISSGSLGILPG